MSVRGLGKRPHRPTIHNKLRATCLQKRLRGAVLLGGELKAFPQPLPQTYTGLRARTLIIIMQRTLFILPLLVLTHLLLACGEDRSGEQPFAPTVRSLGATVVGDSAVLTGEVTASPNSHLTECGFAYGTDTMRATCQADTATAMFTATTDSLGAGTYFAVAYAKNGVGTSYGDTLHFTISPKH